jgi:hypothetical protein
MSYKIIVARYNEQIDWLNSESQNCIIYNKGTKLEPDNIHNEVFLENMGRESDTYLHYIIANYDNLPDIIVFTQARIADHRGRDDVNYLLRIKNEAAQQSKSQNYITHTDTTNARCWDRKWNYNNNNNKYFMENNFKNNTPVIFETWFIANIEIDYPNPIKIYPNAIFAVRKENILRRPIEFYKQLILEVNHHSNPSEGHFMERAWYYIFE